MKINKYEFGHMTNVAASRNMVKSFKKKLLLRNQLTNCLDTWYVVLGSHAPL